MSQKIIYSVFIILLVIAFLGGWQIGKISERKTLEGEIEVLKSYLEMSYPPIPEEIYGISGKVIEISGKTILMESSIRVSQFPLPDGADIQTKNIKVLVNDQTKITRELENLPPLPDEELPLEELEGVVDFSEIKVGNIIYVNSDENIKGKNEIVASKIQIMIGLM